MYYYNIHSFFLFYSTTNIEYLFYSPLPSGKAFGNSILILILKTYDIALANFDFLNFCHKDGFFSNIIDFSYSSALLFSSYISTNSFIGFVSSISTTCETTFFSVAFSFGASTTFSTYFSSIFSASCASEISSIFTSSCTFSASLTAVPKSTGFGITFNASATSIPI